MTLFDSLEEPSTLRPLRGRQIPAPGLIRAAIREGHKHLVAQAPTGYGKTQLAAEMINSCLQRGNKSLFIAPAINLVEQTLHSFESQGIRDVGVMQAQHYRTDHTAALQIACLATLTRRSVLDRIKLVIIDECHEQSQFIYDLMANQWKDIVVIGLSATPWARGMGRHYTKLVVLATMKEMMEDGPPTGLCKWWGYGVPPDLAPDVSAVKRVAGKLDEGAVSKVMSGKSIVGNTVETWLKHRQLGNHPGDRTFLYGVDRAHARSLMEAFKAQGIDFGYMDGETNPDDRRKTFEQYESRDIKGICNVGVLITGVDRDVRCISDNCYTESEIRLVQQHGRGMRLKMDGSMLFVLDHAGNRQRLGNPEDIHHETLDSRSPKDKEDPFEGEKPTPKPRTCGKCFALIPPSTKVCPKCGDIFVAPNRTEHVAGELVALDGRKIKSNKAKKPEATMAQKQEWFSGFLTIADQRGKVEGWAAHRYKEKFGVWPNQLKKDRGPVSLDVLSFDKHARIKYAKSKAKEVVHANA